MKRARTPTGGRRLFRKRARTSKKTALSRLVVPNHVKPRLGAGTVYRYSRYALPLTREPISGSEYDIVTTFSLDQVKTYSDFTSLYDKFKITGVQVIVSMIANPNALLSAPTVATTNINGAGQFVNQQNFYPRLWYVNDYDDAASTSINALRERQGVKYKVLKPNAPVKIFVKPTVLVQTYKTAVTTGYASVEGSAGKRMWLDVASGISVPHYGL